MMAHKTSVKPFKPGSNGSFVKAALMIASIITTIGVTSIAAAQEQPAAQEQSPAVANSKPPVGLQENAVEQQPSPEESAALVRIKKSGGKVFLISRAGPQREVCFHLSGQKAGDAGFADVAKISNVIWLNLAGTNITNKGLEPLALMGLKKLHLERTAIGDDGLAVLKDMKTLEYLNVYGTKVTDEGLKHLEGLKNLKKLYVWQSAVTEEGIRKLNKSLPDLKIVGELKLEAAVIEKQPEPKKGDKDQPKEKPAEKDPAKKDPAKKDPAKKDQPKKETVKDKPAEKQAEGKKDPSKN